MAGELIVDASVAAKCFLTEAGSARARALAVSDAALVAPDLVLLELASVFSKRARRGDIPLDLAARMTAEANGLFDVLAPTPPLVPRAFELAAAHALSVYDATYIALAEELDTVVVTADMRLVERALAAGMVGRLNPLS